MQKFLYREKNYWKKIQKLPSLIKMVLLIAQNVIQLHYQPIKKALALVRQ